MEKAVAYYMNPFHFVPLPTNGPKAMPEAALAGPRWEGYLTYTLETLTYLHITGKTTSRGRSFEKKYFYESCGKRVIPGSSIRGMLSAYIEAVTGSDLRCFTRGDEGDVDPRKAPPYGKWYDAANAQRCRHVGFLMAAPDDTTAQSKVAAANYRYTHHGATKTRNRYERHETLPVGFGFPNRSSDRLDVARFLFGYVGQSDGNARKGRLLFEDLLLPDNLNLIDVQAWDLEGDAVMGSPNPRANTAWYFTPGNCRLRNVGGRLDVWEVLADKVRGRKFYFHQDPDPCLEAYRNWSTRYGGWMPLAPYAVESVPPRTTIGKGRVYFSDLPQPMLLFLYHSLQLEKSMAHKLGGLKPFGFGSVRLVPESLRCRQVDNPLAPLDYPQGLGGKIPVGVYDMTAQQFLKRIMHFPEATEKADYLFLYPPFNSRGRNASEKGFAVVEKVDDPARHPTPGHSKKQTLFFDHYQREAKNYAAVMGGL